MVGLVTFFEIVSWITIGVLMIKGALAPFKQSAAPATPGTRAAGAFIILIWMTVMILGVGYLASV